MRLALLWNFARQDLLDRHASSLLGWGWAFLVPLANILIFTLIFSNIMRMRLEGLGSQYSYSIYLVSGLLAWNAFANTVVRVSRVFHDKAGLIRKVNLSLLQLPVYIVASETIVYAISMGFFLVFLVLVDHPLGWHLLWLPLIYLLQELLAYALGYLLAIFSVFLPDIRELLGILMQLWFWLTPIVYVVTIIPEHVRPVMEWNPAYAFVGAYQRLVLQGQAPEPGPLLGLALGGCLLMGLALVVFRRLERDIRDFV